MPGIEEQFYGEMKTSGWIKKGIKQIPELINRKPIHGLMVVRELEMWVLGPSPKNNNQICVWGSLPTGTSVMRIVRSINLEKAQDGFNVIATVICNDGQGYRLSPSKSAHSIARCMDTLLHGAYTDIPPIAIDVFLDIFHEHFEKEAKENVKNKEKNRRKPVNKQTC